MTTLPLRRGRHEYGWAWMRESQKHIRPEMGVVWPQHLVLDLVPARRRGWRLWRQPCAHQIVEAAFASALGGSWSCRSRWIVGTYRYSPCTMMRADLDLPPGVAAWIWHHDAQLRVTPLRFSVRLPR